MTSMLIETTLISRINDVDVHRESVDITYKWRRFRYEVRVYCNENTSLVLYNLITLIKRQNKHCFTMLTKILYWKHTWHKQLLGIVILYKLHLTCRDKFVSWKCTILNFTTRLFKTADPNICFAKKKQKTLTLNIICIF